MKISKKQQQKRAKIVRNLLRDTPHMKNDDIKKKVKAQTGVGMGDGTIAEIRKHLGKGKGRKPATDARTTSEPPPKATEQSTALEARPIRVPEMDGRHVIVVMGETDAVAEVLRKVIRG